ncbi:MAG: LL-diaminopimelate aminotransferase [Chloroflexi bacterium]|nr:LL-diaminopimelate aminotransferase [Chloroflexota bacterium]
MKLAKRIADLPPYIFAEAGQKLEQMKAKGIDVINLGIGSPDLPPPRPIIDALYESALKPDNHGYAGYYGLPALRRAIADYYAHRFGVEIDPNKEVAVLIGSKEGIFNTSLAFLDSGDVALIPDPGYPTYSVGTQMSGGVCYPLPLWEEHGFLPQLESIPADVAHAAKILWLNYPNNPTGAVADLEFLSQAVHFAQCHDLLLCYDNPYCDLTFDGYRAPSILQVPGAKEVALEFNSLSKTYNMAGWRVGMAVGNREAVEALRRVKTNVDSGIFKPIQEAAIAALTGDQSWIAERNAIYQRRRDVVMEFLPLAGMSAMLPKAALYVWARIPGGYTSQEFSLYILEKTGVWMTPGTAFGEHGEGYVRIALTVPEERLREVGERLRQAKSN